MQLKSLIFLLIPFVMIGCTTKKPNSQDNNNSDSYYSSENSSNNNSSSEVVSSEESSGSEEHKSYGYNHYGNYYGQLTWSDGAELKEILHTIINHNVNHLNYSSPNWESNSDADHTFDDFEYLDVIYSENRVFNKNTNKEWQREHAFPASLMTGLLTADAVENLGRATDFHNLFASAASANSSRGNKNYGVADVNASTYQNRTTSEGLDGYSFDSKTFEPGDIDKGRVARAIFYMCTMYSEDEEDTINQKTLKGLTVQEEPVEYPAGGVGYDAFAIGNLSALLSWANTIDVDYLEMQHNESVYSHPYSKAGVAQNNRNPYVDYPELVDYVFGDKQNESGDLQYLKPSSVALGLEGTDVHHYAISSAKRNYNYGDTLSKDDLDIVSVAKDFTITSYQGEYTHSLNEHTFTNDDGQSVEATVEVGGQTIKYSVQLDSMENCNNYVTLDKSGISNATTNIGVDQTITHGGVNFTINVTCQDTSKAWTLQNISAGGFKMGSGTNSVTKVVLTTVSSYTVDQAYIKARVDNASSAYNLTIKVGTTTIYTGRVTDKVNWNTFGSTCEELTGQVSYIFEGGTALCLNAVAFNEVTD